MPHAPSPTPSRRLANLREEGAVLIVVLMMLLSVSTTAVYTVSAATNELRGAGAMRTSYQTESIAISLVEAAIGWVDAVQVTGLMQVVDTDVAVSTNLNGGALLDLTGVEQVGLAVGQKWTRLYPNQIRLQGGSGGMTLAPFDEYSLNAATPSTPDGLVDVYDIRVTPAPTAGSRSDGYGMMGYVSATYTGRAVTDLTDSTTASGAIRGLHRTSATARAIATSGPGPIIAR